VADTNILIRHYPPLTRHKSESTCHKSEGVEDLSATNPPLAEPICDNGLDSSVSEGGENLPATSSLPATNPPLTEPICDNGLDSSVAGVAGVAGKNTAFSKTPINKFKVGDRVRYAGGMKKYQSRSGTIVKVCGDRYICEFGGKQTEQLPALELEII
jgi:hypothetical protein